MICDWIILANLFLSLYSSLTQSFFISLSLSLSLSLSFSLSLFLSFFLQDSLCDIFMTFYKIILMLIKSWNEEGIGVKYTKMRVYIWWDENTFLIFRCIWHTLSKSARCLVGPSPCQNQRYKNGCYCFVRCKIVIVKVGSVLCF